MSESTILRTRYLQMAFVALLALTFFTAQSATAYAKKPKKAKYGTIKILSTPGGFPISIDGKAYGQTTTDFRAIDLDPGLHNVVVTLPSGQLWTREIELPAGRIKCIALNYRPTPPPPTSPCPFPMNVSAPTKVNEGEIITYTADVSYSGTSNLIYSWTLTPANAHVIGGAGTPTITVDSTGLGGQRITATLVVDDGSGDSSCRQTAQAATEVPQPVRKTIVGREFDTCCSCAYDDQKARLDNLAVELQNDPTTTTYIFAYGGRTSPVGQADRLLERARDYLVSQRGVDESRIILANGGFREEDCAEVWIVPRGATPPQPTPTVQAGDVRPAKQPITRPRRRGRG
jgi:PEGA domain